MGDPELRGHNQPTSCDSYAYRLLSVPYIDFREAPDGVDGSGAQIAGDLTPQTARSIAAILNSGPLPAELVLVEP